MKTLNITLLFSFALLPALFIGKDMKPVNKEAVKNPPSIIGKWYIQKITLIDGSVKNANEGKGCLGKSYIRFGEDHIMYNQWLWDTEADTCFVSKLQSYEYHIVDGNRIVNREGSATFSFRGSNTLIIKPDPEEDKDEDTHFIIEFKSIEYTRGI